MWSFGGLDLRAIRRQHPHRNLQAPSGWVNDRDRTVSPFRSAEDLKGNAMERMKRVEDLDIRVFRAQGIVGVGAFPADPPRTSSTTPSVRSRPPVPRRSRPRPSHRAIELVSPLRGGRQAGLPAITFPRPAHGHAGAGLRRGELIRTSRNDDGIYRLLSAKLHRIDRSRSRYFALSKYDETSP